MQHSGETQLTDTLKQDAADLAKVNSRQFGITVCTAGGKPVSAGSANTPFSI